jgi:signal transduction histidine kinase
VIDAYYLHSRIRRFGQFCGTHGASEEAEAFSCPTDRAHAEMVKELTAEYERYKAGIETRYAEEMEFITKWLHDAKVPISAARLILESQENRLPDDFYRNISAELFSIEESILQVFYEMKTNRFYDDYKITSASTRKLIAQALKGYSNFFSYKKLGISVRGEDCKVLTDEKWSCYIISQLISNAVKYTPEGGAVEIETIKEDGRTSISVKNQGRGIPVQDLDRIFQKGFTSSEDRDGAKATGYGLFLSKKLNDLLGHSLTAESVQNEYAIFRLTFYEHDTLLRPEAERRKPMEREGFSNVTKL